MSQVQTLDGAPSLRRRTQAAEGIGLENRQWGHTQPEFESPRLRQMTNTFLIHMRSGTFSFGGGAEIRTRAGCDTTVGFQDRSLQPLGYASVTGRFWVFRGAKSRSKAHCPQNEKITRRLSFAKLVPPPLVEKRSDPYHGSVLPLNYRGGNASELATNSAGTQDYRQGRTV